jgi:hypothetical protein
MEKLHEERVFTQEELDAKRKEMLKFYKESAPYLKAQLEYEELLMKIDEVRFKRTNIQMQFAMMAQAQQDAEKEMAGGDYDLDEDDDDKYPFPTPEEMAKGEFQPRKLRKQ